MDPQSAAHLIRILRTIAIELHIANDLTVLGNRLTPTDCDSRRATYREEMT